MTAPPEENPKLVAERLSRMLEEIVREEANKAQARERERQFAIARAGSVPSCITPLVYDATQSAFISIDPCGPDGDFTAIATVTQGGRIVRTTTIRPGPSVLPVKGIPRTLKVSKKSKAAKKAAKKSRKLNKR